MTEHEEACEVAHLCPQAEAEWFRLNEMDQYTSSWKVDIDHSFNLLLLRTDIHRAFDQREFVFIPKGNNIIHTHVLGDRREHRILYHNTKLHPVALSPEYLFTRFAWAIFPQLRNFLQRGRPTLLSMTDGQAVWANETMSADYARLSNQARTPSPTKSRSPTKRTRSQFEEAQEDYSLADVDSSDPGSQRQRSDPPHYDEVETEMDGHLEASTSPPLDHSESTVLDTAWTTSDLADEKVLDLDTLINETLLKERARSDPHGHWVREHQWATDILAAGGALDSRDYARFWRAVGCDDINEVE